MVERPDPTIPETGAGLVDYVIGTVGLGGLLILTAVLIAFLLAH